METRGLESEFCDVPGLEFLYGLSRTVLVAAGAFSLSVLRPEAGLPKSAMIGDCTDEPRVDRFFGVSSASSVFNESLLPFFLRSSFFLSAVESLEGFGDDSCRAWRLMGNKVAAALQ